MSTLPLSNWPSLAATSLFDLAGNFDSTNPVLSGASQQFFRLLVGGTVPPVPTGPSITTQPQNQTVLEGQNATFSVSASGTAPLFYQWYSGTTLLTDEAGQALTIEGAQTGDAGGYSVVVSNSVNSVTSVVATLTVNPPSSGGSAILVDDTWLDGTRTDTVLPDESAWFASSASTLNAAVNSLTGTVSSSSVTWWTYFTSSEGPATLNVGETLKVTLLFTPDGVNASNGSRGLRIGLFDFTDGTRKTSDSGSPGGAAVKGYLLNMNFGQTFGVNNPLEIRERTDAVSSDLMASSGDYTTLSAGGGSSGSPGFSSNVPYIFELSVQRNAASVDITTTFSDGNGWSISHTATDTNNVHASFDCIAIRPDGSDKSATTFAFSRCKVEITTSGPVPPSILTQPQSQTVSVGENAAFNVTATGTPPLSYQWYFNTNTPLANATNATLTVTNAQSSDAGTYSVVASNAVGSVASAFATLTVTAPSAPMITTEPEPQTVFVGQTATFSVIATGTSPLSYQWYFNTNTALTAKTNATLTISNAQTNDAGVYSVIVSNYLGTDTSAFATLTVDTNVSSVPNFEMSGYATLNGGATGGAGGATVTVSNFTDFNTYVGNNTTPYIIQVLGTINLGGSNVRVRNNKTIIGLGTNATLVGDLKVDGNNNVIIRNLNFTNPDGAGDNDGLTLQDCLNVWVDHCTFYDGKDGNLDITHGADWITVSWCRFFYTNPGASHRFSNLVGHSDNNAGEDAGKLHVTFHHNWWGQYVHERMPRVRFGRIHSYNNYFNSPGNNYCFRVARDAEVRIENNYFLDVKNPWEVYVTTGTTGKVYAVNNIQVGTSFSIGDDAKSLLVPGTDTVFVPAYSYTLDPAANVPAAITNHAGAGKGPYAP
jgi:pectate lyase